MKKMMERVLRDEAATQHHDNVPVFTVCFSRFETHSGCRFLMRHLARIFVIAQAREARMPEMIRFRPVRELYLGDEFRL